MRRWAFAFGYSTKTTGCSAQRSLWPLSANLWGQMCFLGSKLRRSKTYGFAESPGEVRLRREAGSQSDLANLTVFAE
jgi:hypothetical protein